jgi:hypothetical protein
MENQKNGMAIKIDVESRFARYCGDCKRQIPAGERFIELIWDAMCKTTCFCLDCAKNGAIRNDAMRKKARRWVNRILKRGERFDAIAQANFNSFCVEWNALVGIRPESTTLVTEVPDEVLV